MAISQEKNGLDLKDATMQGFLLYPCLVVVLDDAKGSGVNILTVSYVGVLSEDPPIIGIAVRPSRYSHSLILATGEFTLNAPSLDLLAEIDFCGTHSGKNMDKAAIRKIELEPPTKICTPLIKKSPMSFECILRQVLFLSKDDATHDYFIANIIQAHQVSDCQIENLDGVVTANYNYRRVRETIGRAHVFWQEKR